MKQRYKVFSRRVVDRDRMTCPKLTIRITRCLVVIVALTGLSFLSWGVTIEYFMYKTISVVAIREYPEEVTAPAIALCARVIIDPRKVSKVGQLFTGNFLNDGNGSWRVTALWSDVITDKQLDYVTNKYLIGNKYCLLLQVKNVFKSEELTSRRIGSLPTFYFTDLTAEPFLSENLFLTPNRRHDRPCRAAPYYIQILGSNGSSRSSPKNPFLSYVWCTRIYRELTIYLTYTQSVSVKLPPPFETNCLDYPKDGRFMSSGDCIDECLKRQVLPWKVVPGDTVIERKWYWNSTFDLAPPDAIEDPRTLKDLVNSTLARLLLTSYQVIHARWKEMKKLCQRTCNRPDCLSERITPQSSIFSVHLKVTRRPT